MTIVHVVGEVVAPPGAAAQRQREWQAVVEAAAGGTMVSIGTKNSIPSPWETLQQAITIFSDPFYRKAIRVSVSALAALAKGLGPRRIYRA